MMGFKNYKQELEDHGASSVYVPLPIGEPVRVLLVGDEITGPSVYIEATKKYIKADYDQGGRLRFVISAVHNKKGRLLDGPETLYREIGKLADMVDIEKNMIAITKVSNKKYEVRGLQQLNDAQIAKAKALGFPDPHEHINWLQDEDGVPAKRPAPRAAPTQPPPDDYPFASEDVDDSLAANEPEDDLPI